MNKSWKSKAILFLSSQSLSLFGSSVVQFAIIWYITKQTSSGIIVTLLTLFSFIPQMLISFVAGSFSDRHNKKYQIILSDSIIALATLALIIIMPMIKEDKTLIIILLIITMIRSIGTGIQQPAVNAFLPELVPQEKLMKINGINSTCQSVIQFISPLVAGAVLTIGGIINSLYIDIITAIIATILLIGIPSIKKVSQDTATTKSSIFTDIKLGANYTFSNSFLRTLLISFGIFIFLSVPAGFLATLFVTRTYGDTYLNMTLVEVIGFIGMMLGGILISTTGGFKNRAKTLIIGLLSFGVLAIGMGVIHNFIVYLILMAIYGIALTLVQTATITLIQEKTSPDMQGRVFGLMNTFYSAFLPLGMLIFGPLSDYMSIHLLMILSGVLLIVMGIVFIFNKKFYHESYTTQKTTADTIQP